MKKFSDEETASLSLRYSSNVYFESWQNFKKRKSVLSEAKTSQGYNGISLLRCVQTKISDMNCELRVPSWKFLAEKLSEEKVLLGVRSAQDLFLLRFS